MRTDFSSRTLKLFFTSTPSAACGLKVFAFKCLIAALALSPGLSPAQDAQAVSNQASLQTQEQKSSMDLRLEQLKAMQAQVQQNFEQKNLACNKKFAVTSCKIDAFNEKNELMGPIKKEQAQISQAQKKLQSEQRMLEISERESPQELERVHEKARVAQESFDERSKAHAQRLEEHERQLNMPSPPMNGQSAEQRAKARQEGIKSAQEIYDDKLQQANEHRQEQRQRLANKTLHPKPLPLPPASGLKASDAPASPLSPPPPPSPLLP